MLRERAYIERVWYRTDWRDYPQSQQCWRCIHIHDTCFRSVRLLSIKLRSLRRPNHMKNLGALERTDQTTRRVRGYGQLTTEVNVAIVVKEMSKRKLLRSAKLPPHVRTRTPGFAKSPRHVFCLNLTWGTKVFQRSCRTAVRPPWPDLRVEGFATGVPFSWHTGHTKAACACRCFSDCDMRVQYGSWNVVAFWDPLDETIKMRRLELLVAAASAISYEGLTNICSIRNDRLDADFDERIKLYM